MEPTSREVMMGLGVPSLGRCDDTAPSDTSNNYASNPNPERYKILDVEKIGMYLLLEVQYLDCTNYEGRKLLMYREVALRDLTARNNLDPHFSPDKFSPIARFRPDVDGWIYARQLARTFAEQGM